MERPGFESILKLWTKLDTGVEYQKIGAIDNKNKV